MPRLLTLVVGSLTAAALWAAPAAAQESNFVPDAALSVPALPGWSFTPSLTYGGAWDDNVLIRGNGDATPADFVNVVNPRATLDLNGRRGQLTATYNGAFLLYRDLNSLNSYDQRLSFDGRRFLTPRVSVFVRNSAADVPTTELSEFIAVPFVRTGSRIDDLRTGIEAALTKRTSVVASYDFEWVKFDQTQPDTATLLGGHSHGATVTLKHALTARAALTATYDVQHAIIGSAGQTFDVQNTWAGGDYKVTDVTHVFAEAGVSRLAATEISPARTGPAWRAGVIRQVRAAAVDLLYTRSFVPSYGFGGTMQNEEATGRFSVPFSRRVYSTSAVSWRRNDPLTPGELPLQSYWVEGTLGFAATRWVHLELFYSGTRQTIEQAGGTFDRNRVGFQITTVKPMRVQ